ncbi:xanthine dehydrogenase family protein molybdopterin-binding subunit [Candidatus Poribacteria bacterium]|nr:xanthine dehydrogenase family protein molybdopterin-binding subunit [Candidatus Poribacteria bacterium]
MAQAFLPAIVGRQECLPHVLVTQSKGKIMTDKYAVVGKRVTRPDAVSRVTGEAVYAEDVYLPGMLYGALLRSPHPHARILRIDTAKAEKLAGVKAVITARSDIHPSAGSVFARDEVLYSGQKVAAVAAVDKYIAQQAVNLIEVEYEILPAVFDVMESIKMDAPVIHESRHPDMNNICSHSRKERGDIEQGFSQADIIVENRFDVAIAHQSYLEPHACVADVDSAGKLTVWTTTQGQFGVRSGLANLLKMPVSDVRVVGTQVGGGFGGKNALLLEPTAAMLAMATECPVKLVMSRQDELVDARPGPGCVVNIRTGALKDGTLVALQAEVFFDTGAFPGATIGFFDRTRGLYRIPHFQTDLYSVYTNKMPPGAYRAPGAPEITFAFESQMDIMANELGLDPIDFRLFNAVDEGDLTIDGKPYPPIALKESLMKAKAYVSSLEKKTGIGIACGKWMNGVGTSGVTMILNEDGTLNMISGAIDLTGLNTSMAQMAAEELGLPLESVKVITPDTDTAPPAAVSGGSRSTYGMGLAILEAAKDLRQQLIEFAAEILGTSPERLELAEGYIRAKNKTEMRVHIAELARRAMWSNRGPITARGSASAEAWLANAHVFITQVAEITVDEDTGRVDIHKISSFQDVGFAINPMSVEGQIQGGISQGLGWGIMEGLIFDNGIVLNDSILDYKIPTAMDVPELVPVILEVPSVDGPYGLKGAGEPSMVATPAVLANAIYNAVGVRIKEIPITQRKILIGLRLRK